MSSFASAQQYGGTLDDNTSENSTLPSQGETMLLADVLRSSLATTLVYIYRLRIHLDDISAGGGESLLLRNLHLAARVYDKTHLGSSR